MTHRTQGKIPKIFVYGYFGANNAGDELILFSFLNSLREKGLFAPEAINIASNLENNAYLDYFKGKFPGVENSFTPRSKNPLGSRNLRNILTSDCLVVPGGGVFQDYGALSFLCYSAMAAAFKLLLKDVFLIYQGFTGVRKRPSKVALAWLLKRFCRHVSVRDERSLEYLKTSGAPSGTGLYSDAAFLSGQIIRNAAAQAGKTRDTIGISLRPWKDAPPEDLLEFVESVVKKTGLKAVLYSMQKGADCKVNEYIIKNASGAARNMIENFGFEPDFEKLARSMAENSVNMGMRFHFSVLSMMCGVPAVGISYDKKVSELYKDINLPELCAACREPVQEHGRGAIVSRIKYALRNSRAISEKFMAYSIKNEEKAKTMFEEFINFLK